MKNEEKYRERTAELIRDALKRKKKNKLTESSLRFIAGWINAMVFVEVLSLRERLDAERAIGIETVSNLTIKNRWWKSS